MGVGTVVDSEQVRAAAAAGARFVVSPGLVPEVIETALTLGLEPVPGVFTATEILAATAAGARVMKLFPASCGGPSYLRALRGPFPTIPIIPTGGVRIDEVQAYLDAGATVIALGSELVGRDSAAVGHRPRVDRGPGRARDGGRARRRPVRAGERLMRLSDLETPVLVADLDAIERNVSRMQAYCDEHGVALRPHIKTHKLPELARLQLEAGAVGITCQKLGEAEVMADAGVEDILLSFPLVGEAKAERLAALARRVKMTVVGDSAAVAEGLSPGARPARARGRLPGRMRHGAGADRASRAPRRRPSWPSSSTGSRDCASPG